MEFFEGRNLYFATMHAKEKIVSGKLREEFGIHVHVAPIDTDLLGTFTGEIKRRSDPLNTARMKINKAKELAQGDLFLSSEGSFGPHPAYGILPCNEEWLVLKDFKFNLEIIARGIYLETNFSQAGIANEKELMTFSAKIGFPDHAIILYGEKGTGSEIIKGIRDEASLIDSFHKLKRSSEVVHAESDMRAMMNPTRQRMIAKTLEELIGKMKSLCPVCFAPGWSITGFIAGLPCAWCGMPTKSSLYSEYTCTSCQHREKVKFPHGKDQEDPMYCDYCNP